LKPGNPLVTSLMKSYKEKNVEEFPNKVKTLGVLLNKYHNQKHFIFTSNAYFRDGPKAIISYLQKN
jgi:hypothetical protein